MTRMYFVAIYFFFIQDPGASYLIDFTKATVANVHFGNSVSEIEKQVGPKNLKKEVEYIEGEASELHVISIGAHKIYRHWSGIISFRDPIFKTKEGLGVGSTIGDFTKHYGNPSLGEGEGGTFVNFFLEPGRIQVGVKISSDCVTRGEVTEIAPTCVVNEIWMLPN